jgi:archaemetzincin
MKRIDLLPVGKIEREVLEALREDLTDSLRLPCEILADPLDPAFARHGERGQYDSSQILARMRGTHSRMQDDDKKKGLPWRILGVTSFDLYIPILTFVFGEAEVGGGCAVISTNRLSQEFYGLPADQRLERKRILKEAVHELGHTFRLMHCEDYRCVMAPSHSVEWIDIKGAQFCAECSSRIFSRQ